MRDEVATLLKKIGLEKDFDPDQSIAGLSGGERQAIAIARAMFFEAELILLDEPTNNLGVEETRRVLDFIREARDAGRSSVLITHSIVHALQVVDRIVILRRGRVAAELDSAEVQLEDIELLITG
jgi:simple sugar transport system ATP-binding protein